MILLTLRTKSPCFPQISGVPTWVKESWRYWIMSWNMAISGDMLKKGGKWENFSIWLYIYLFIYIYTHTSPLWDSFEISRSMMLWLKGSVGFCKVLTLFVSSLPCPQLLLTNFCGIVTRLGTLYVPCLTKWIQETNEIGYLKVLWKAYTI